MSKYSYEDDLGDDPFFSPCVHCGCPDFYMDWDEMIYKCSDCNEPTKSTTNTYGKEKKPKEGVKKFKGEN